MKFFSSLVIINILLIEPVFSQIVGVLLDIDEKPGPLTYVGVIFIMVAINIIQRGSNKREEEQASELDKKGLSSSEKPTKL